MYFNVRMRAYVHLIIILNILYVTYWCYTMKCNELIEITIIIFNLPSSPYNNADLTAGITELIFIFSFLKDFGSFFSHVNHIVEPNFFFLSAVGGVIILGRSQRCPVFTSPTAVSSRWSGTEMASRVGGYSFVGRASRCGSGRGYLLFQCFCWVNKHGWRLSGVPVCECTCVGWKKNISHRYWNPIFRQNYQKTINKEQRCCIWP